MSQIRVGQITGLNVATLATPLTGYTSGAGSVASTDTILSAIQKLNGNIGLLTGSVVYQGTWNASTNSPTLTSGTGTKGYLYKVSTSGTTTLDGNSSWNVGDQVVFDGTTWDKIDGIPIEVLSVFGRTGAVVATSGDYNTSLVTENTNLYFTNARAIAAPLTGYTSGAGTISASDTILSAIQKLNGNIAASVSGVASVFGRTGAVVATSGDYNSLQVTENTNLYFTNARAIAATLTGYAAAAGTVSSTDTVLGAIQKIVGNLSSYALLASPTFTGTPTAPTPVSNVNTTQIPTAAWVNTYFISQSSNVTRETPTGTINGTNAAFTLANAVLAGSEEVYLNGLLQTLTSDYTISGSTITFVAAPFTGDTLRVSYII